MSIPGTDIEISTVHRPLEGTVACTLTSGLIIPPAGTKVLLELKSDSQSRPD